MPAKTLSIPNVGEFVPAAKKPVPQETLGQRIAQARRKLGVDLRRDVTPADLAKMLGTNPTNVYRWESDEKVPREETLLNMASLFSVSVAYLRYGETLPVTQNPPAMSGQAGKKGRGEA